MTGDGCRRSLDCAPATRPRHLRGGHDQRLRSHHHLHPQDLRAARLKLRDERRRLRPATLDCDAQPLPSGQFSWRAAGPASVGGTAALHAET